ncbi:hypothetical protein XGA_0868 [Xanthomonas hortorum ATCC 19865]|nr:hypothetical protein XGA_0868 [Xanthomonas hortorum ATCC 19865]
MGGSPFTHGLQLQQGGAQFRQARTQWRLLQGAQARAGLATLWGIRPQPGGPGVHAPQRLDEAGGIAALGGSAGQADFDLQGIARGVAVAADEQCIATAGANVHQRRKHFLPPRLRGFVLLRGVFRQALQIGGECVQQLTGLRLRASAEAVQCVAFLHQRLAQIEVARIVHAVECGIGQRIGTACAVGVAGNTQALLAEPQQQFHFIQTQRLRAMSIGIGQFLYGFFEQRAALAQPEHFIA